MTKIAFEGVESLPVKMQTHAVRKFFSIKFHTFEMENQCQGTPFELV